MAVNKMLRSAPSGSGVWETLYSQHDKLFADNVMKEADWERRRKATHRHRLQPVTLARVMLGYFPLLLWVAVLSVAVGIYDITLVQWYRWPMLSVNSVQTFFSAITFALTLLLVFKTNSSYARWWEARKDVGQLVSLVQDIVRQAVAYIPPHQAHLTHAVARWSAASMWVGKALVRQAAPLREELRGVLLPEELNWLMAHPHKQLALGQALSCIVAAAQIDPITKFQMDSVITKWTFTFGAFGRIYNTAIPSAYTRHTSRFLMCYILLGLPLLLWPLAGWSSPVLAVLISFLLLGVENIGAFIEEPFHVIAFDAFCVSVQRDVNNILAMHDSSQCSCCATRSNAWGGNVPVVVDLTVLTDGATEVANPGSRPCQDVQQAGGQGCSRPGQPLAVPAATAAPAGPVCGANGSAVMQGSGIMNGTAGVQQHAVQQVALPQGKVMSSPVLTQQMQGPLAGQAGALRLQPVDSAAPKQQQPQQPLQQQPQPPQQLQQRQHLQQQQQHSQQQWHQQPPQQQQQQPPHQQQHHLQQPPQQTQIGLPPLPDVEQQQRPPLPPPTSHKHHGLLSELQQQHLQQQQQQQQELSPSGSNALPHSDSRTCLLSIHSHTHAE